MSSHIPLATDEGTYTETPNSSSSGSCNNRSQCPLVAPTCMRNSYVLPVRYLGGRRCPTPRSPSVDTKSPLFVGRPLRYKIPAMFRHAIALCASLHERATRDFPPHP